MDQYKQAIDDLTHLKARLDQLQIWKNPQLHTQIKTIKQSIDQIADIVEQESENEKEYQRMKLRGYKQKHYEPKEDDFLNIIDKLSSSGIQINQPKPLQNNPLKDQADSQQDQQQNIQYVSSEFLDAYNEVNNEANNIQSASNLKQQQQSNFQEEFYQEPQIQKQTAAEKPYKIKLSQIKKLQTQPKQLKTPDKIKFKAFREFRYNLDFQTQKDIKEAEQRYEMTILKEPIFTEKGDQEICPICYENFFLESEYQEQISITLLCKHSYHWKCLQPMLKDEFLKCPVCNKIYGIVQGDQPDGTMEVKIIKQNCSGYKCDTIQITYNFRNGVKNGINYTGTNRVAYLPNNNQGQFVLNLLKRAFEQKLIFTIGTSITTGQQNSTIWNGIHHKTSMSGGPDNYGYPDPTYIDRVIDELKQRGIR